MTTKEDLWHILNDLTNEEFKHFKWFLKDAEEGFRAIPEVRLEKADQQDTVDQMVQNYGTITKALQKTTRILKKIHRNDLVQCLSTTGTGQRNVKNINSAHPPCNSERQKAKLEEMKTKTKLMIQERKKKIGEIQRSAELSRKSADRQISDSKRAFTALIQSAQRSSDHVAEEIKERQRRTQKEADGIIHELKQEISELSKREAELNDNLGYNQSFSFKNWTEVTVPQPSYEETVTTSVNALKETLAEKINKAELRSVQLFAVDVVLDPDTAHPELILSDDGKQVHHADERKDLPDNPKRFRDCVNVLGKQSFSSGRFYFEVQVKGKTDWTLGVSTESIDRKGELTLQPESGFWTIYLRNGDEYEAFDKPIVHLPLRCHPQKVGVFVDYKEGLVSFYDVDTADLLYSFTRCCFAEKLLPFFSPCTNVGGMNSAPLIISPVNLSD
ncbi:nuclear factor 7, brain-like [Nematolebias whitei]|uniref:nuclear factor 7, brain-like n=1 Tax=Nematolebias whitei TaxID=451745 RepID=UPI001897B20F|nr:nuclear factor 7, brain-like [Nematolebias whitei]